MSLDNFLQDLIDVILRHVPSKKTQTVIFQGIIEIIRDQPKEVGDDDVLENMVGYTETWDAAYSRVFKG